MVKKEEFIAQLKELQQKLVNPVNEKKYVIYLPTSNAGYENIASLKEELIEIKKIPNYANAIMEYKNALAEYDIQVEKIARIEKNFTIEKTKVYDEENFSTDSYNILYKGKKLYTLNKNGINKEEAFLNFCENISKHKKISKFFDNDMVKEAFSLEKELKYQKELKKSLKISEKNLKIAELKYIPYAIRIKAYSYYLMEFNKFCDKYKDFIEAEHLDTGLFLDKKSINLLFKQENKVNEKSDNTENLEK